MTFAQQADVYIAGLKARKRRPVKLTSLATFESMIRRHAIPFIGGQALEEIDNESLRLFVAHLTETEELSPRSVRLAVTVIKQVIASAVDSRGNPLFPRKWNTNHIDAPKVEEDGPESVTREQIEAALQKARPRVRDFLAVLCGTGLRKGEALALRVEDFDPSAGVIHVRGTRSRFGVTAPKTKSSKRVVNVAPEICSILQRVSGYRREGFLFPFEIEELRRAFNKLGIKAHGCRRFRASWLRYQKCHEDVIRYWLGHSSGNQTDNYVRLQAVWPLQTLVREIGLGFSLHITSAPPIVIETSSGLAATS